MMAISRSNRRYRSRPAAHHTPDGARLQWQYGFFRYRASHRSGRKTSLCAAACSAAASLKDIGKLRPLYQASNWSL